MRVHEVLAKVTVANGSVRYPILSSHWVIFFLVPWALTEPNTIAKNSVYSRGHPAIFSF
jgi:hypothetical protein